MSSFVVFPHQNNCTQTRGASLNQTSAEVCKILNIRKSRTTPYHPQCDGLIERFNRTLLDMLATTCKDHPFDWEDHIRKVCMAYNTSTQSTTGYTPFFLMFGSSVVTFQCSPTRQIQETPSPMERSLANSKTCVRCGVSVARTEWPPLTCDCPLRSAQAMSP